VTSEAAGVADARERRWIWALAAIVLALQITAFHRVRLDDAYITYRYGQNLASGAGLVFNPGERLMASTSPGESLLAALVYAIAGRDRLPSLMASIGCVGWTAQALFVHRLLRGALGVIGASAAAIAVAIGAAGSAAWVPLETNVTAALTLFAMCLALESRWTLAAIAAAAATMMRPDASLVTLPLFALCMREKRLAAWRPAIALVLVLLPWTIFAWRYFGTPLPQSAVRKFQRVDLATFAMHAATYVPLPFEPERGGLYVLPMWLFAIGGAKAIVERDRLLAILPAYGALHLIAYAILRTDPAFQWHLYPASLVFLVLEIAFFASLAGKLRALGKIAAIATLAYGAWWTVTFAIDEPHRFWFGRRDALYRRIAAYVGKRANEGEILFAEEAGTLGYLTNLAIDDSAGLVSREPARPLREFVRGEHGGEGDRLRWLVMNDKQLGELFVVYQRRPLIAFDVEGARLYLADLRTPNPSEPP
jgi:hypothetical protein